MTLPLITILIYVSRTVRALHHWPEPTPHRAYLGQPHLHNFRITVGVEVGHEERQLEFHDLGDKIDEALGYVFSNQDGMLDFGGKSCETIARELLEILPEVASVAVAEDEDHQAKAMRS